jgi:glucokinase
VVDELNIIYEKRTYADFTNLCKSNPPDVAWRQIITITSAALNEALQQFPQVISVGIGFPGFIDPKNGHVAQSPNLPGLKNVDLAGDLARAINKPVIVENDALAAAYGEFRLNATQDSSLIYIGLGTGVGGGLIYANKPFTGEHGVAMEIGHLIVEADGRLCGCGNHGCLEQYASATGVTISYAELVAKADGQRVDASQIAILAKAGDKHALAAYVMAGDKLGQALAHILKVVDVGQVIIGGGMSKAWPLMQQAFNQRLQADLIPALRDKITIKISSNDDQAGIIGAALLAGVKG